LKCKEKECYNWFNLITKIICMKNIFKSIFIVLIAVFFGCSQNNGGTDIVYCNLTLEGQNLDYSTTVDPSLVSPGDCMNDRPKFCSSYTNNTLQIGLSTKCPNTGQPASPFGGNLNILIQSLNPSNSTQTGLWTFAGGVCASDFSVPTYSGNVSVTFTSIANSVGEFYEGSFSGTVMKSSLTGAVNVPISGTFKSIRYL
jgi:hypothetical protein